MSVSIHSLNSSVQIPRASREAGLDTCERFLPRVADYAALRGYDQPGHAEVSGLSPYLRHRLILEEEVVSRVLELESAESSGKFIDEVCWRTYWKGWMETHPSIWNDWVKARITDRNRLNSEKRALLDRIRRAETGLECFDYWTRELLETGYLHNHARLWFASIWIFTLELPWTLGADFFFRHLLDGDAASNTLSWRWVGGLHTEGKHYVARASNIERYTCGRFNPAGKLNENPQPLQEDGFSRPVPLRLPARNLSGLPSLSDSPAGLLILDEDLVPEVGEMADWPFSSVAVIANTSLAERFGFSDPVLAFRRDGLADAARRAAAHWSGELRPITDLDAAPDEWASPSANVSRVAPLRVYSGASEDWVGTIVRWAEVEHLRAVRLYAPTTGPWRPVIDALRRELSLAGVVLHEHRRLWDQVHWPQASRGFFDFRQDLAGRLRRLGIG